jgi:hypothetical protein
MIKDFLEKYSISLTYEVNFIKILYF